MIWSYFSCRHIQPFLWHLYQENIYSYLYSILKCFLSIKISSMYSTHYHKITQRNKRVKVDWICHTSERYICIFILIEQYLSLPEIIAISSIQFSLWLARETHSIWYFYKKYVIDSQQIPTAYDIEDYNIKRKAILCIA